MSALHAAYDARVARGLIRPDLAQRHVLDALSPFLIRPRPGLLSRLIGIGKTAPSGPRGLYLFGGVGRGKTMLMDLFYETAPEARKYRVHFHAFMAEVHDRLHALRTEAKDGRDPLARLAAEWARRFRLLCFDEFHVVNIADAMILGRLFSSLWDEGVVTIMTSNWAPNDLYRDGLQRDRFLPFIALLNKRLTIVPIDGGDDYRLAMLQESDLYFRIGESPAESRLDSVFTFIVEGRAPAPVAIHHHGRVVHFARHYDGVLWTSFDELCGRPLAAVDYLALARRFHVVLVEGVPRLTPEKRQETKRFMTFIDVMYDAGVRVILAATDEPDRLLVDDFFHEEFQRTVSRLMEMRRKKFSLDTRATTKDSDVFPRSLA
ncbi:MAG TPA: cell division protein ZapE [Dongiaceae bacterium]|jgi:cell division protein ZapE|nr:cell division protein ZapE [Dongiaceae bacterium]